jgi:predicted SPOUT superfamily RNA methylase MTH1
MPHHLRGEEWCEFREGVVISNDGQLSGGEGGEGVSVVVDAGLPRKVVVKTEDEIAPNTRITVRLPRDAPSSPTPVEPYIRGTPTHPSAPRTIAGYYWGYTVRRTASLSGIFTEAPYPNGYTLSIGTSERGKPISSLQASPSPLKSTSLDTTQEQQQHIIIVFGGVAGLEAAARGDEELRNLGVGGREVEKLFDWWVDVCPGQGSRTIRTEEAVWLGLMGARGWLTGEG